MPDTLIKQYIRGSSKYHRSSGGGGGGHLTQCTSNTNLPAVVVSTTARRRGTCVRWIWVVSLSCVHPIKLHVHFPFGGRIHSTFWRHFDSLRSYPVLEFHNFHRYIKLGLGLSFISNKEDNEFWPTFSSSIDRYFYTPSIYKTRYYVIQIGGSRYSLV
jgi:hypothetical protein